MPETYRPGQRKTQYGKNYQIEESRYAWIQCEIGKFMILVGPDEGSGSDVVFFHPRPGKLPAISWNLCSLTSEELTALSELFATAADWARPVVERRDKEAQDAWDQGDDSHVRNYRPVPTVVYRKRPKPEHREGLRERPDGVPEGRGSGGTGDSGGVRGTGDELVEPPAVDPQPEDDRTQVD